MGLFDFLKTNSTPYRNKLERYYLENNYPNLPALPSEEEAKELIEGGYAGMGGLVPKENMKSLDNGLLRGHIVMLWWINDVKRSNVPRYFIFEYGLDFNREVSVLQSKGYLENSKTLTTKGKALLDDNKQLIREHRATKSIDVDGKITYHFTDKESVENVSSFKSSGDFIKDQHLGKAFESNKDYENAIKAYKSAIRLAEKEDITPPNPFYRLAVIYRKLKRKDDEIAILEEGIKKTNYPQAKTGHNRLVDRLEKLKAK